MAAVSVHRPCDCGIPAQLGLGLRQRHLLFDEAHHQLGPPRRNAKVTDRGSLGANLRANHLGRIERTWRRNGGLDRFLIAIVPGVVGSWPSAVGAETRSGAPEILA